MSDEHNKWVPVAEAAVETTLPVRTIYNWVNSGSITSRKDDGTTSVLLAEVRAKVRDREAAARKPALLPAASAGTQLPATNAGTDAGRFLEVLPQEARSAVPLEILAYLIRLFEQGVPLQSIVEQLRLPPLLAIEARRQYDLLVSASGRPTVLERVSAMEEHMDRRLGAMEARISQAEEEHRAATAETLNRFWGSFESQLRQVNQRIDVTREDLADASRMMNLHAELQNRAFTSFTELILSLLRPPS
jgi:DNA-binding transcriptional MerR regulator